MLIWQSFDGDDSDLIGAHDDYLVTGGEIETSAMGEGAIEGVASDYEVRDFVTRGFFRRISMRGRDCGKCGATRAQDVRWLRVTSAIQSCSSFTTLRVFLCVVNACFCSVLCASRAPLIRVVFCFCGLSDEKQFWHRFQILARWADTREAAQCDWSYRPEGFSLVTGRREGTCRHCQDCRVRD